MTRCRPVVGTVHLFGGLHMKMGARNQLQGKVVEIKRGTVMCQVKVEVAGGARMESVMTLDSLDELGLKVGDTVKVAVKAVNVMLVKE
jgi:molybdopterin-binding protein